jgi:four helix bundle protein
MKIFHRAEGFDSRSDKIFVNFLNYAYRSATEVQSLIYVASDQKYISQNEFNKLYSEVKNIHGLIGGLIKYLKSSK